MSNIYLTKFDTEVEYEAKKNTLSPPNVSLAEDTGKVFYTPEISPARSWLWGGEQIQWGDDVLTY